MKLIKIACKVLIAACMIISCKPETEVADLDLDPDPLRHVYVANNITSYVKTHMYNDSITFCDSVCVDAKGNIRERIRVKGYALREQFKYDSLGRIKEYRHDSDIHFINRVSYTIDHENNKVLRYSDHVLSKYYKFDKDFRKLKEVISLDGKDTLFILSYAYENGKISAVKHNERNAPLISYKYDRNNKLNCIVYKDEIQYISLHTGLIDSIRLSPERDKVDIKYYTN